VSPDHIYFLCLALIVIPLLPFSRTAAVVGIAWLPGQFASFVQVNPRALDIGLAAVAFVLTMKVAANDRDRAIGWLYLPTFAVHVSAALGWTHPYDAWWLDWYLAMARVALLPATVNVVALREVYVAFKERRQADDVIWKRVLCWQ